MLRNQLDIINCTETTPSDGNEYASFTSPSCGGLCKCWEKGSLQMELVPYAIVTFILYSCGFIVFLFYILKKHRVTILEDQYLRALGYADNSSRLYLGDECFQIRKRYSRMYYHFRPEYYFWILVVIGRKISIALTSLLYRKNPSFQFAVALLVMFISFVLQVKYKPYMSPSKYQQTIDDIQEKACFDPNSEYGMVKSSADMRLHHSRKRLQTNTSTRYPQQNDDYHGKYSIDFNVIEGILLSCGVFVCLSGVCFENIEEGGLFHTERVALTWITIFVVIASFIYFFTVTIIEIGMSKRWKFLQKNDTEYLNYPSNNDYDDDDDEKSDTNFSIETKNIEDEIFESIRENESEQNEGFNG